MMSDRRRHPRVDTNNLISYFCIDQKDNKTTQRIGKTIDISQEAILIETHKLIESKYILLTVIGMEDEFIQVKGIKGQKS